MLKQIFYILLGITLNRYFIVSDDNNVIELNITHKPDSIILEDGNTYLVLTETSEIKSKFLVYNWLKLEKI